MIADDRQVAVALSPRDLVDRDLKQTCEPVAVDQLLPDTLDDPSDRLPVDPRQPAGGGLVGLGRKPGDQVLEVAREPRAVAGERDALHVRAVLGATNPPEPGVNLQPPAPEIEMAPDRVVMLPALPMARGVRALRAMQATPAQRDRHDDSIRLEADRADPHPGQAQQAAECSRDAHGEDLQLGDVEHPRAYGLTRARLPSPQPHPAPSEESPLRRSNPTHPTSQTHLRSPTEPPKTINCSLTRSP